MAGRRRHGWRLPVAAVMALYVALAAADVALGQPMSLQGVPIIDLNGRMLGAEAWLAEAAWVAYLGGGWEFADPADPNGTDHDGVRFRLGLTIPISGQDVFDMRVVHW
ncbi:MAG: hypothetical protein AB1609_07025, partial [Bacillota bacterium]